MTRQRCVPSHEGSVLFGTSSVCRREPLVGRPSTAARIDFSRTFLGTLQIMPPNAQQRAAGPRKPRFERRKRNIVVRFAWPCDGRGSTNLAAVNRSLAAPISMPSAPITVPLSVPLPGGKGGCIVQKIDDLAALATASWFQRPAIRWSAYSWGCRLNQVGWGVRPCLSDCAVT